MCVVVFILEFLWRYFWLVRVPIRFIRICRHSAIDHKRPGSPETPLGHDALHRVTRRYARVPDRFRSSRLAIRLVAVVHVGEAFLPHVREDQFRVLTGDSADRLQVRQFPLLLPVRAPSAHGAARRPVRLSVAVLSVDEVRSGARPSAVALRAAS